MAQHYSDPSREDDKYSLPNVETYYVDADDVDFVDEEGNQLAEGWYYWFCLPGCMPDSSPFGPFDTEAEALEDARDCEA